MERELIDIKNLPWEKLSVAAWKVRENAFIIGKTKVGAAILSDKGNIFSGCNCEHKYRMQLNVIFLHPVAVVWIG